jgi:hypothetical protein
MEPRIALADTMSTLRIVLSLIDDAHLLIPDYSERERDYDKRTVIHRVNHEGFGFLSKTLPKLGEYVDSVINNTRPLIPPSGFRMEDEFVPVLLRGLFRRVIDREGRILIHMPSHYTCVSMIRQITLFCKKVKVDAGAEVESETLDMFISTEQDLEEITLSSEAGETLSFASFIASDILRGYQHDKLIPRIGPGSVVEGYQNSQKWSIHGTTSPLLESRFPSSRLISQFYEISPEFPEIDPLSMYYDTGYANERKAMMCDYESDLLELTEAYGACARYTTVPKTSTSVRPITIEPSRNMLWQQAISRYLRTMIEEVPTIAQGQINFSTQDVNRALTLNPNYATLDLKDASNRLHNDIVRQIISDDTPLGQDLQATRSQFVEITIPSNYTSSESDFEPGETVTLDLCKYAGMGNATTFVVQSVCFWTIIVAHLSIVMKQSIVSIAPHVFIYGDDIIVPVSWAWDTRIALESVGLLINAKKSCIYGDYRESCGAHTYRGHDINIVKLRSLPTGKDSESLASSVATANLLYHSGLFLASECMFEYIESFLGTLPNIAQGYECLGRETLSSDGEMRDANPASMTFWDTDLQKWRIKNPIIIESQKIPSDFSDSGLLLKSLCTQTFSEDEKNHDPVRYRSYITRKRITSTAKA